MTETPVSLLRQLRDGPAHDRTRSWARLVDLFTPLLFDWARRLRLQDSDAADLVQDVFAALLTELPRYDLDARTSFRGWLWTLTVNKFHDRRRRPDAATLVQPPAGEAGPDPADTVAEAEYAEYLVARALQVMQTDFEPATWRACWAVTVEGRSAAEAARETGLSVAAVYAAKARVLRRLREELEGLVE